MINKLREGLPSRYVPDGNTDAGGFGEVLFCDDKHLERKVAVKTIHEYVENIRLNDEITALMALRSKHVVQILDIIKCGTNPIGIVMEFIDGKDLVEIDLDNMNSFEILKILWQLASGIADIHEAGIIHRDIKFNNMKIDSENILKIYDFGLSRTIGVDANTTNFKGTHGFAAPEQYGLHVHFTKAVDVYAFGVIALFLSKCDIPETVQNIPPTPLPQDAFDAGILNGYPDLKNICLQCLSLEPTCRPEITLVKDVIGRYLLQDQHQALTVSNNGNHIHVINSSQKVAKIGVGGIGSLKIEYNDLYFRVTSLEGSVYINNIPAKLQEQLLGSCVITLGEPSLGTRRHHITFDISNPEVSV